MNICEPDAKSTVATPWPRSEAPAGLEGDPLKDLPSRQAPSPALQASVEDFDDYDDDDFDDEFDDDFEEEWEDDLEADDEFADVDDEDDDVGFAGEEE